MSDSPVFKTGYAQGRANTGVWYPLVASACLGLAGLYLDQLPLTLFSAFITLSAIRNWPLTDPGRVVLRLSSDGLDLDGLGRIIWASIDGAALKRGRAPKARPLYVEVRLNERIDVAAIPIDALRRRPWEIRPWRPRGTKRILVFLHDLSDPPEDVAGAFAHFLSGRFSDDADLA